MSDTEMDSPPHEPVLIAELGDFEALDVDSVVDHVDSPDEWLSAASVSEMRRSYSSDRAVSSTASASDRSTATG